jgi:hypothetical protein
MDGEWSLLQPWHQCLHFKCVHVHTSNWQPCSSN